MRSPFVDALARHTRERPMAPALADDRARLTWAEVAAWVRAAAGWLLDLKLPRGAAVLGWLPNAAEWYLLRLAAEYAGLLWVPVSANLGLRELRSIVARVRPAVLFAMTRHRGRDYVAEAGAACRAAGIDPLVAPVPDSTLLRLAGPLAEPTNAIRPDEHAHVLATTGTEGTPKLSLYTLAAAAERARDQAALVRLTPDDVVLALSSGTGPGKTPWLAAPLVGAAVVAVPEFRPEPALATAVRERATVVAGTPAQLTMLLDALADVDVGRVRLWYAAGAVLSPAVAESLEARSRGIVVSVYGATDFGGWAAPDLDDPPDVRHRTVGRPRGGTEIRIVDRDGRDVPRGAVGEIVGRGRACVESFGRESGPATSPDTWRRTGDIGRFDEDGNLVIVGRARDLIVRGGDNIAPAEIENLLRVHPGVADVAVVGVPDRVLGERVCACVVPAPGEPPTLGALREHLRAFRVAHYKLPERLVLVDALPTVEGKLNRAALVPEALRAGGGSTAAKEADR
jgi:2,3-dihydroxybenzoate-AMP ligase/acyl-CoA synthetase